MSCGFVRGPSRRYETDSACLGSLWQIWSQDHEPGNDRDHFGGTRCEVGSDPSTAVKAQVTSPIGITIEWRAAIGCCPSDRSARSLQWAIPSCSAPPPSRRRGILRAVTPTCSTTDPSARPTSPLGLRSGPDGRPAPRVPTSRLPADPRRNSAIVHRPPQASHPRQGLTYVAAGRSTHPSRGRVTLV